MATRRGEVDGLYKHSQDRVSGTRTVEEIMAGEMAVIADTAVKPSTKAIIGYRRVSSIDQMLDGQSLKGFEKIFDETESGAKRERPALIKMIEYVREGDEVRIHSIDRLARDLRDLQDIPHSFVLS